jgi:hypothetical protein
LPIRTACRWSARIQFRIVWLDALSSAAAWDAVSRSWSSIALATIAKNAKPAEREEAAPTGLDCNRPERLMPF